MDGHRIVARLALAALTVVAALGLGGLFATPGWLLPVLGAALIPHALGAGAEVRRIHGVVLALGWAFGLFFYAAWVTVWDATFYGLPGPDALSALADALGDGGVILREGIPPVDAVAPVVAVAIVGVWLVAANADWLAFRAEAPLGALVPSLILVIATVTLERDAGRVLLAGLYVVLAAAYLATAQRDRMERRRAWLHASRTGSARRLGATAAAIAVAAALLAVVVAPVLPGSGAEAIIDVRGLGAENRNVRTDNPLVRLSGRLNQNPPVELFTVTSPQAQYWRLVALEEFDGHEWKLEGDVLRGDEAADALRRGVRENRTTIDQAVRITSLEGRFLPAAYNPIAIDLPDVRVVNAARALVVPDTTLGMQYVVTSQLPPGELDAETVAATAAPVDPLLLPLLELPPGFPDEVRQQALAIAGDQPTPWQQAQALEAWFTGAEGGFTYSLEADYGAGNDAILEFLQTREGFCEQFAAAYAAMARALGIPARVAVGFTPGVRSGGGYVVSTRDAHAWVEVYMHGLGWMTMEPTPAGDQPGQPPTGEQVERPVPMPGEGPAPTTAAPVPTEPGEVAPTTTIANLLDREPEAAATGAGARAGWWRVVGIGVGLVLLLALAGGTIVALKRRRRAARRGAADPAVAIGGAWAEALERLREVGYEPPPSATPAEVAADAPDPAAGHPALHALADELVVAVYSPHAPDADAATRAWAALDELDAALTEQQSSRSRWRHRLDPRPLLPHR